MRLGSEIEAFERDGVVCLRGVLSTDWIQRMQAPFEEALRRPASTDLGALARGIRASGGEILAEGPADDGAIGEAGFVGGRDHWLDQPEFRAFATESPLPEIAAMLMRSAKVNLYEDSVLVKEPGTPLATAFHQDLAYFHVEGSQVCTFWRPLDPATPETGALSYVKGSHRWGRLFRPNLFVSRASIPGTEGEEVPDIERESGRHDFLHFDMQPGDVAVHHARTLHGAPANGSLQVRRRAISVRYCGDDARYRIRPGAPMKPHHAEEVEGRVLDRDECPVVWRRRGGPEARTEREGSVT